MTGKLGQNYKKFHVLTVGANAKMNLSLLIGIIATIFILTVVLLSINANAEPVTIEIPHDINMQLCETFEDERGVPFTQCVFEGALNYNPDLVWDDVDKEYKSQEQLEVEAKELYEEFIQKQLDKLNPEERIISNLQKQTELSVTEQQLLSALERMGAKCSYDIGAIQTLELFDIPTESYIDPITGKQKLKFYKNYDLVSIDLKSNQLLKKIKMATEACIGQSILRSYTVTNNIYGQPSYEGKKVCVYGCNTYHAEHTYNEEFQQKVNTMMETGGNIVAPPTLREIICLSDTIGSWFKQQNACPITYSPSTLPQPENSFWSDESRQIMSDFDLYDSGDDTEQYSKLVQNQINKDTEKRRR